MATNDHLRTRETADAYSAFKATGALENFCPLCEKPPLQEFKFWKIILNDFPYDLVASKHDMVVPLRHTTEHELTAEEREELYEIKYGSLQEYDIIVEATHRNKSIPEHFHLHLVNLK